MQGMKCFREFTIHVTAAGRFALQPNNFGLTRRRSFHLLPLPPPQTSIEHRHHALGSSIHQRRTVSSSTEGTGPQSPRQLADPVVCHARSRRREASRGPIRPRRYLCDCSRTFHFLHDTAIYLCGHDIRGIECSRWWPLRDRERPPHC